ncbi:hypothetical protein QFZ44_004465 [Pantoea agglomerans]|nr:hypothetical protein [Pantoea agglomerans]
MNAIPLARLYCCTLRGTASPALLKGKKRKDYRVTEEGTLTVDDKLIATTIGLKPLKKPQSDSKLWIVSCLNR